MCPRGSKLSSLCDTRPQRRNSAGSAESAISATVLNPALYSAWADLYVNGGVGVGPCCFPLIGSGIKINFECQLHGVAV
jgi:hypothetical protein